MSNTKQFLESIQNNLNEAVFEIDYARDGDLSTEEAIINNVKEWLGDLANQVKIEVKEVKGPGAGWPEVRLIGDKELIGTFLNKEYNSGADSLEDTYNLYLLKESDDLEEIKKVLAIEPGSDEEVQLDNIYDTDYDLIWDELDNEEQAEYLDVAKSIRRLGPDEAFIDVIDELNNKAKTNGLEKDILTYVYLEKLNSKKLKESDEVPYCDDVNCEPVKEAEEEEVQTEEQPEEEVQTEEEPVNDFEQLSPEVQTMLNDMSSDNAMYKWVIDDVMDSVIDYEGDNMDEKLKSRLEEITEHGCQSGTVSSLIYYTDTVKFFDNFNDEIYDMVEDVFGAESTLEMLQRHCELIDIIMGADTVKNYLAWMAYEVTCSNILDSMESA